MVAHSSSVNKFCLRLMSGQPWQFFSLTALVLPIMLPSSFIPFYLPWKKCPPPVSHTPMLHSIIEKCSPALLLRSNDSSWCKNCHLGTLFGWSWFGKFISLEVFLVRIGHWQWIFYSPSSIWPPFFKKVYIFSLKAWTSAKAVRNLNKLKKKKIER